MFSMLSVSTPSSCTSASNWRFSKSHSFAFAIDASMMASARIYRARALRGRPRTNCAGTIEIAALGLSSCYSRITCALNDRSFGSYVILGCLSAANITASEAGGTILGVSSKSGTLNSQISPVEAKVASAFPPNCSSARNNSRVPKPR
jgi:hypothetical protein